MNVLQQFYPGEVPTWTVALVLIQMTVVISVAALAARLIARHGAAARYGVWFCALVCVLLCPLLTIGGNRIGLTIVSIPIPDELSVLLQPGTTTEGASADSLNPPSDEVSDASGNIDHAFTRPTLVGQPVESDILDIPPGGFDITNQNTDERRTDNAVAGTGGFEDTGDELIGSKQPETSAVVPPAAESQDRSTFGESSAIPRTRFQAAVGALTLVWIAGVVLLLIRMLRGLRWVYVLRRDARPLDRELYAPVLAQVAQRLDGRHPGTIAVSRRVPTPLAIGLWRPTVLIPHHLLSALSKNELEDVLVHECAHSVRRDLVVGLLQRLLAMVFWPHPLIHLLNRRLSRSREEVCDNHVLRNGDARRYAGTLLRVAEHIPIQHTIPVGISLLPPHWKLEDRVGGLLDKGRNLMTRVNRLVMLSLFAAFAVTAVIIAGIRLGEAAQDEPAKAPTKTTAADTDNTMPLVPLPKNEMPLRVLWSTSRLQSRKQHHWPLATVGKSPNLKGYAWRSFLDYGKPALKPCVGDVETLVVLVSPSLASFDVGKNWRPTRLHREGKNIMLVAEWWTDNQIRKQDLKRQTMYVVSLGKLDPGDYHFTLHVRDLFCDFKERKNPQYSERSIQTASTKLRVLKRDSVEEIRLATIDVGDLEFSRKGSGRDYQQAREIAMYEPGEKKVVGTLFTPTTEPINYAGISITPTPGPISFFPLPKTVPATVGSSTKWLSALSGPPNLPPTKGKSVWLRAQGIWMAPEDSMTLREIEWVSDNKAVVRLDMWQGERSPRLSSGRRPTLQVPLTRGFDPIREPAEYEVKIEWNLWYSKDRTVYKPYGPKTIDKAEIPNYVKAGYKAILKVKGLKFTLRPKTVEKNGLKVSIKAVKPVFEENEPLAFDVTYENVSKKPYRLNGPAHAATWDVNFLPGPWRAQRHRKDLRGVDVLELGPGKTVTVRVLDKYFRYQRKGVKPAAPWLKSLPPGEYQFQPTIKFQRVTSPGILKSHPGPYWAGEITPQPAKFTIAGKKPVGDAKSVEKNGPKVSVKALQLSLKVQPNWEAGEMIDFVCTYRNVSDKPIRVPAWNLGSSGLEITDAKGRIIKGGVGNDGERVPPIPTVVTLQPGAAKHYLFSTRLRLGSLHGEPLSGGWIVWKLSAGELRVRAVFDTTENNRWAKSEKLWRGKVRSPAAKVTVDEDDLKPPKTVPIRVSVHTTDPKKTSFKLDEPIKIRIEKRNDGTKPLTVWHCGFFPNHKLIVKYADGTDVPLTELGRRCHAVFGPNTGRNKNVPFQMKPKTNALPFGPYDLRRYFDIKPGRTLHVRCRYLHGTSERFEYVWSNDLILTVSKLKSTVRSKAVVKDGLKVSVIATKPVFKENEPLTFDVTYQNVSKKPFRLNDPTYVATWDVKILPGPWRARSLRKYQRLFDPRRIDAGKTVTVRVKLDEFFRFQRHGQKLNTPWLKKLPPGEYRFQPTIRFGRITDPKLLKKAPGPYWAGEITPPPTKFTIVGTKREAVAEHPNAAPIKETAAKSDVYERFNQFCRTYFGAEKEPLVYQTFGKKLAFPEDGRWSHVSENSAVISWGTNLPAVSYIEYGETEKYGKTSLKEERQFYLHTHYLKGLQTGKTYHYRLVSIDERGNMLTGKDRLVTPKKITGAIYIPGNMGKPPYRLNKPGTYVLTADINADVTAIDIMANNVVLDLNGQTITYDKSKEAFDKVKDTQDYKDKARQDGFGPKPSGGPHGVRGSYRSQKGVRVLNGIVRQGKGGHSWWSAPITTPDWEEVAGVTMVYDGPQVNGIEGWVRNLHHNVFLDRGTRILNRHQGTAAIQHGANAHHNLIKRARHRGIDAVNGGKVYRNEIYIDSFATNAFGVFHYKTRGAICNENRIFGTGYHFIGVGTMSSGVGEIKVVGNFIHGRTLDKTEGRWSEYGDQSGVNGLRAYRGEDIEWSKNVVVVEGRGSAKGEVRGVWLVPDRHQSKLVYRDNIVKAVADPEKKSALGAIVISGGNNPKQDVPGLFHNNMIISDYSNVSLGGLYYGDGTNGRFVGNTFVRIGDRKDYRTIQGGVPRGSHQSSGHVFIDSNFKDDAGYTRVKWRGDGEFEVGWTATIRTTAGTDVTIEDKTGRKVFSGKADAKGIVQTVLMQFRHNERGKTTLTPHTITVGQKGETMKRKITADRTRDVRI